MFAAIPTPASLRLLCARHVHAPEDFSLRVLDVTTAFLHADAQGPDTYVVPPDEYCRRGGQQKVWLLKKSLYGMRASPKAWQEQVTGLLQGLGYLQGRHDSSVFAHPGTRMLIASRGRYDLVKPES